MVCTGRFYDFFEKRTIAGASCCGSRFTRRTAWTRWIRGKLLPLDQELLQRFPEGYRHLAYLQTNIGYKVKTDMPGLKGPKWKRCTARKKWLAGEALQRDSLGQSVNHQRLIVSFPRARRNNGDILLAALACIGDGIGGGGVIELRGPKLLAGFRIEGAETARRWLRR